MKSMTREDYKETTFKRDSYRCVVPGCGLPAVDAHHLIERRLWADGGYHVDNLVSVCSMHHIEAEKTNISVEELREYAGIIKKLLPDHMYDDQSYDKWGNPILANGTRLVGELFHDESVQKILSDKLNLFTHHVKYPRTTHVPWSPGMNDDDRILINMDHFKNKEIIVTEKYDGENFTGYKDYFHARSLDGRSHPSRDWVKNFWTSIGYELPERWRVCGENLYAKHSIGYDDLKSYFYGFSIWNDKNICLSWDETLTWFDLLGIEPVPVIYRGIYDEKAIKAIDLPWDTCEGYVVRVADSFPFIDFKKNVAKCVRKGHVQTQKHHWQSQQVIPNKLLNQ